MSSKKGDRRQVLVKVGVALALSFGSFLFSRVRSKKVKSLPPPPLPGASSRGSGGKVHSEEERISLRNDTHTTVSAIRHVTFSVTAEEENKVIIQTHGAHGGDKDGFLLPEFHDDVMELDFTKVPCSVSPKKETETPILYASMEKDMYEEEIENLKNMVRVLRERETNLEVQLLEYYGLKKQEAAFMELQNRLKLNDIEAKLLSLKIESLQVDNRKLQQQVADHAQVVADLETARSKIRLLKKKLSSEAEQNKEQLLHLQKRVEKLQTMEQDSEMQENLHKLKRLEDQVEELRKSNMTLHLEKSDLAQRLESTQILANCVLEDPETEALKRERELLRREKESLTEEVELLQANRCSDIEELVYLRWINACLRYELRNYQPPSGKPVARDLGKTLSPNSEDKAKQLTVEYATTTEVVPEDMTLFDFDSDRWSSSFFTDSGELGDSSSFDNSLSSKMNSSRKKKKKLLVKLRKLLVLGKGAHEEEDNDKKSSGTTKPKSLRRVSSSGSWPVYTYKKFILGEGGLGNSAIAVGEKQLHEDSDELTKYAKALKGSWGQRKLKPHRKTVSADFAEEQELPSALSLGDTENLC